MAQSKDYLDFYDEDAIVKDNVFKSMEPDRTAPPVLADVRHLLPEPQWAGHAPHLACYWKAWELAFKNLQKVHRGNGFVSPYIDTAFNDCTFMWDSSFMLLFGRYGSRAFNFQRTLDNFYGKQHPDGFICREIREWSGGDQFHRGDPASTGPNILVWCEWEYFMNTSDLERLRRVFPPLLAYHRWCRRYRTWPDGSYFSCGLACGMDNQPRPTPGYNAWLHHSYMAWVDATAQALLSARLLLAMAARIGHATAAAGASGDSAAASAAAGPASYSGGGSSSSCGGTFGPVPGSKYAGEVAALAAEVGALQRYLQEHMWDEGAKTFADRRLRPAEGAAGAAAAAGGGAAAVAASSSLSEVRTVGAYWTLLADVLPPGSPRLAPFLDHLDNPALFNRPVRVPSLAANHPAYSPRGGYWLGGVWPPTSYMVLRGLTRVGADDTAADIGRNYNEAVVRCFTNTGTIWENMSPEPGLTAPTACASAPTAARGAMARGPIPGDPAKGDFVGWGGLGPIAVLLEYVFGLRADVPGCGLEWDVRLMDGFGVKRFPYGASGWLDLQCDSRGASDEPPRVTVTASGVPALRVVLRWGGRAIVDGGSRAPVRPALSRQPFADTFDVVAAVAGAPVTVVHTGKVPASAASDGAASGGSGPPP